ncbi:MAG TPA: DinB family protein [Longimicrobiales bacterium]|nr:DinB family protein [Longimicrobiales bacterium]
MNETAVASVTLREWIAQAESVRAEARAIASELTTEQFNWRAGSSRWSVGQCLHHITLTVQLYPDGIERMIAEARTREAAGERPYREGRISRLVVNGMEPPPKLRMRTKRSVVPALELEVAGVLAAFDATMQRLEQLMLAADGISLRHGRMRSPFMPLLRFTLGQVLAMNLAHARRHLWQARAVLRQPGFPR